MLARLIPALLIACALPAGALDLHLEMPDFQLHDELPEVAEEPNVPRVSAAAWCAVRDGDEETPGCDVGVGMALYRWERLSVVSVLGTHTLGAGLSWTAHVTDRGQVYAVAVGVVVPHDELGIDARELWLAFGATVAFTGAAQ